MLAFLALVAVAVAAPPSSSLRLVVHPPPEDAGEGSGTAAEAAEAFPHIWENTGWCPPDMKSSAQAMHTFSMQEANWQNHAFIAAVPNRGLKYVRIHSMLNLITVAPGAAAHPIAAAAYNFTLLDDLLDMVALEHGLRLGFEIMGNPRTSATSRSGVYTSWQDPQQLAGWRDMVRAIASRYIARYGAAVVGLWRFETWNEPDHGCSVTKKMNANITCDQSSWLGYWDACVEGLQQAGHDHSVAKALVFGGPGSGAGTTTSWVLPALVKHLGAKKKRTGSYGCSFIQWHNKGMLPGENSPPNAHNPHGSVAKSCNSYVDRQIVDSVVALDPELAASLPMGNEEVDMQGGWSKRLDWHADATNAAGILRILAMHEDMLNSNATLQKSAPGLRYGYHANDNAFLNYGDAWFNQRTLTARIEMNLTNTVEVVRKPAINTMAMLSLLTGARLPVTWSGGGGAAQPQPATPTSAPYGAIATQRTADAMNITVSSVILWNSNGTQGAVGPAFRPGPCLSGPECAANVTVQLPPLAYAGKNTAVRVYRMDESHGNPNAVFLAQRGGKPMKKPYPTASEFEAIRAASELPSCNPLSAASAATAACEGVSVGQSAATKPLEVTLPLPQPSVALVHVCTYSGGTDIPPATGNTPWKPALRLRATTTPGEMFVRWADVDTKCLGSFELAWARTASSSFSPVLPSDTLFTAFVHQQPHASAAATGCYKVRWTNMWGATSPFSKAVCVKPGQGTPRPFVNA